MILPQPGSALTQGTAKINDEIRPPETKHKTNGAQFLKKLPILYSIQYIMNNISIV